MNEDRQRNQDRAVAAVKAGYARTAHAAGDVLTSAGLLSETPPARDERLRHWMYSLTKVHDSLAMDLMDVPWWTYRAIDVVDAWLAGHSGPVRVMEFGCGSSTLWLSRRATEVHSVEHHAGFAEQVRPAFSRRDNIALHVVPSATAEHPAAPSGKEGYRGQDFTDYVATVERVGGTFDLVVVDGRARSACLAASLPHLAPSGMVLFDNSARTRYRPAIASSGLTERRLRGLAPTLPYPDQTSLLVSSS